MKIDTFRSRISGGGAEQPSAEPITKTIAAPRAARVITAPLAARAITAPPTYKPPAYKPPAYKLPDIRPISKPPSVAPPPGVPDAREIAQYVDKTRQADQAAVEKYVQEALAAERGAVTQAINTLSSGQDEFAKSFNALSATVGGIMGAVKEAQEAAALNDKTIKTLAANIEANLAAIDEQMRAQADAIVELARGVTETFTPRQVVSVSKAQARRAKQIAKQKKVSTARQTVVEAEPVATEGGPEVMPALEGWSWASALHR